MTESLFIHWAPSATLFSFGSFGVRWYSLCWVAALLLAYLNMGRLFKLQRVPDGRLDKVFFYCFFGVLIGARLGHCLFYEPMYYLNHLTEMFLPIARVGGHWRLVGYEGLASHGGVVGLLLAIWLFCRSTKMKYLHILDNMGIITPLSAAFIRLGNLMNSEIVGLPTSVPWGFVFANNGEDFARHPAQLYESLFYLCLFFVFWAIHKRLGSRVGTGFFFGLCLTVIFTFRFLVEIVKDDQVAFEAGLLLNMGQILSLPLILIGAYFLFTWHRREAQNKR